MIRPLPKTLPIPHPSRCHWRLDPRHLRCHELGPPTFQTKVMPLAGPQASHQLNPALMWAVYVGRYVSGRFYTARHVAVCAMTPTFITFLTARNFTGMFR